MWVVVDNERRTRPARVVDVDVGESSDRETEAGEERATRRGAARVAILCIMAAVMGIAGWLM
jgi:hypothetical protein